MRYSQNIPAVLLLGLVMLAGSTVAAQDTQFPYRGDYPEVSTIGVHDLYAGLESSDFLVVDVRSKLEFDVIHVEGALHIPISKGTFAGAVKKLAAAFRWTASSPTSWPRASTRTRPC